MFFVFRPPSSRQLAHNQCKIYGRGFGVEKNWNI